MTNFVDKLLSANDPEVILDKIDNSLDIIDSLESEASNLYDLYSELYSEVNRLQEDIKYGMQQLRTEVNQKPRFLMSSVENHIEDFINTLRKDVKDSINDLHKVIENKINGKKSLKSKLEDLEVSISNLKDYIEDIRCVVDQGD
jgi:archaellum component FlaC